MFACVNRLYSALSPRPSVLGPQSLSLQPDDAGAALAGLGRVARVDDELAMVGDVLPVVPAVVGDDDDTVGSLQQFVGVRLAVGVFVVFEADAGHVQCRDETSPPAPLHG